MAAPLLITINPVFVLSSRPWARASLSFMFKIKSDPSFRFPIFHFPKFHLFLPPSRHFAPFAVNNVSREL